ncbi:chorismate--pyruvate lyase family protein [Thalassotalea sp. LPB0316]|uniref:chorismate--pyruvate lyase family protein n=1 Tax=Thalassotalea sp. LPB0316 TaxID=2769490 RepID=UPI001D03DC0D|nr:chorismate lyase [Thalassotalea sp. LPB0316]
MSSLQHLFPINLSADWQNQIPEGLNTYVRDWLLDESSLTARLKANATTFRLAVLGQQITYCSEREACIYIKAGERVLAREVVLFCDDKPQVFARSLLPLTSLTGEQKALAELGEQPLGQVIFSSPKLKRKALQIAEFSSDNQLKALNHQLGLPQQTSVWGRRSTFLIDDKPILVAEVFLPNSLAYKQG